MKSALTFDFFFQIKYSIHDNNNNNDKQQK